MDCCMLSSGLPDVRLSDVKDCGVRAGFEGGLPGDDGGFPGDDAGLPADDGVFGAPLVPGIFMSRVWASMEVIAMALSNRSSGRLAMLFRMISETACGICGLISAGGVGGSCTCCMMIATVVSPRNGGTPVAIS